MCCLPLGRCPRSSKASYHLHPKAPRFAGCGNVNTQSGSGFVMTFRTEHLQKVLIHHSVGPGASRLEPQQTIYFTLHCVIFQKLWNFVLRPHHHYAAAYVDDMVGHTKCWAKHLVRLIIQCWRTCAELNQLPKTCYISGWQKNNTRGTRLSEFQDNYLLYNLYTCIIS